MGRKIYLPVLLFLSCLIVLSSLSLTSAAVGAATLVTPATSATIGGVSILNVTIANQAGNFSCNFYAGSALSANTTWTLIAGPISNNTAGFGVATAINLTFDTNILQDSNDYQFNSTCYNNTGLWTDDVNTGITVDNSVPSVATSLLPADGNLNNSAGDVVYTSTVIGQNTTACTINIGIDGGSYTAFSMTHSGNACSYTDTRYTSSAINGLYYWYITTSDGTNSSVASTINKNNVQIPGTSGGLPGNTETAKTLTIGNDSDVGDSSGTGKIFIVIAIVGVVGYFLFKKK